MKAQRTSALAQAQSRIQELVRELEDVRQAEHE